MFTAPVVNRLDLSGTRYHESQHNAVALTLQLQSSYLGWQKEDHPGFYSG